MTTRTKAALALVLLLAAAVFLAVRVSAGGGRHPRLRARLDLVERPFADLTTGSDPGPPENKGCPRPICEPCTSCATVPCGHDADGDGVDDCADACPCRPGADTNRGCPTGQACQTDADCDDGNGCSLDVCMGGVCEHKCLCLGPAGFDCRPGPAR